MLCQCCRVVHPSLLQLSFWRTVKEKVELEGEVKQTLQLQVVEVPIRSSHGTAVQIEVVYYLLCSSLSSM